MAAYQVYENPNLDTKGAIPFLLDVQSELLSTLGTRLVVPLYQEGAVGVRPLSRLTPVVGFEGRIFVAMVPEMAGVPKRALGRIRGDLGAFRSAMLQAIDLLLTGF